MWAKAVVLAACAHSNTGSRLVEGEPLGESPLKTYFVTLDLPTAVACFSDENLIAFFPLDMLRSAFGEPQTSTRIEVISSTEVTTAEAHGAKQWVVTWKDTTGQFTQDQVAAVLGNADNDNVKRIFKEWSFVVMVSAGELPTSAYAYLKYPQTFVAEWMMKKDDSDHSCSIDRDMLEGLGTDKEGHSFLFRDWLAKLFGITGDVMQIVASQPTREIVDCDDVKCIKITQEWEDLARRITQADVDEKFKKYEEDHLNACLLYMKSPTSNDNKNTEVTWSSLVTSDAPLIWSSLATTGAPNF